MENNDSFKRKEKGILTPTQEKKKDIPEGFWKSTPKNEILPAADVREHQYVAPSGYHFDIGSTEYFEILFDDNQFTELNPNMQSQDPLKFEALKKYSVQLEATKKNTGLQDAVRTAYGKSNGAELVVACMDFKFIGGSMGSVVGEKLCRAIDHAIDHKKPLLIISQSGGARMMEAPYSLMQMVRVSAKLTELADAKMPYISLCTHPTTGGVTASYAMLGDINIAEPNAMVAFAGKRVIQQTMRLSEDDFPEGFQTSEYLLENGFLDFIIDRKQLKNKLNLFLDLILNRPVRCA